ncbi:MAG: ATP-grasp domain-containing protein [Thermoanaerobaculia bacterium]|nr:MAG: ATP-grasp domain-containing protein [Thermoanaerobaculia bacterium]MBZ0103601.1 ATP-grasp domain-containing protein [Thermoanaerobaculia bacterium]
MTRNVVMISPGYPAEMPYFTRALSQIGARVIGLGEQPRQALPEVARAHVAHYVQVRTLWDEIGVVREMQRLAGQVRIDQVECLWEPGMILAARIREALGLPGMTVEETLPFRDKGVMKQRLDAAGIRTPRHQRARTSDEVREAAERIGWPVIVKPIAGAGSADTHRCDSRAELEQALRQVRHVEEVSVEEFVEAEEFTFDTICADGRLAFENVCLYKPRPLQQRQLEWVSPQSFALRDLDQPELVAGRKMGRQVLDVLGFRTGFTHMEWYRKADGEVVFGEIGARPPGARLVDLMNYCTDNDTFVGWAEAACFGQVRRQFERKWNVAVTFKRAKGEGRIRRIAGLDRIRADFGANLVEVDLTPIGAPRRNWKATLVGDGYLIVRHPELQTLFHMADRIAREVELYAG